MQLKKSTRIKDIYITKTILQISSENGYKISPTKNNKPCKKQYSVKLDTEKRETLKWTRDGNQI